MEKKKLIKSGNRVYRILEEDGQGRTLVIDCIKRTMPVWRMPDEFSGFGEISEEELYEVTGTAPVLMATLSSNDRTVARHRYTVIADILSHIGDEEQRTQLIHESTEKAGLTQKTVRKYLCEYLVFQTNCDENGVLMEEYPTFHQFRYFYSKYKKMQSVYISREGMKKYKRDYRPLLGDRMELPFLQ